ncbi:FeoA domain-containing protein [Bacteroidota bacterium]
MIDPLIALLSGIGIILIIMIFLWQKKGISSRKKLRKIDKHKVLIEDTLKHLYHSESDGISCTLNSIAGTLSVSMDEAAKIVSEMESRDLLTLQKDEIKITNEGRLYALRIIRVHRLWERYLADETSIGEEEWHLAAEEVEHYLSPEQADSLAAQIGNPVIDPHGDPIPSADGNIPAKKGRELNSLKAGEYAVIVHIEDEPNAIYSQLVAEGLYPGKQVQLLELNKERIRFLANGEEVVLAPLFAKNITVTPIKDKVPIKGKLKSLSSLSIGEKGIVLAISKRCRGQQRRRLMDLGVVPGTEIEAEMKSIGGDPVAYRIRGTSIALRKDQAEKIFLKN